MEETVKNLIIGLNDEVISPTASLVVEAHNWFGKPGHPHFGKTKIDIGKFPSLTSLNDGLDVAVNGLFLLRFNTMF